MCPPSQITSKRCHWPSGLSTSCLPRKPSLSSVGVASKPIDALPVLDVERLAFSAFLPDHLAIAITADFAGERKRNRLSVLVVPGDENEIAHAAFDDLHLDRRHPGAAITAVCADAVNQKSRIFGSRFAIAPGSLAPLEFQDEVVIAVFILRREPPQSVAGDVQHLVGDAKHLPRIVIFRISQVGVKSLQ